VIVAGVITSARRHLTQKKALMMFAQLEDLTASTEVTVFPRTYEATHKVWVADEIVLVLARVEQRDDQPKLLAEYAVAFTDEGIVEIQRRAEELRASLVKRRRFMPERVPGPPPIPPRNGSADLLPNGNGNGNGNGLAGGNGTGANGDVVIRFRQALDYERSSELFHRLSEALARHAGEAAVVIELPRAGAGSSRMATTFHARPSAELVSDITREVGEGVVDVVLPRGTAG